MSHRYRPLRRFSKLTATATTSALSAKRKPSSTATSRSSGTSPTSKPQERAGVRVAAFAIDRPDPDELAAAEAVCRRFPVRQDCADYAVQVPVSGLWAGVRHGGKGQAQTTA
jgi:hypothetical protein